MKGALRRWGAALALGLWALLPAPALTQTVELDAQELRALAWAAVQEGYADQALAYADDLLARDPEDVTALIIRARALRLLGRYPDSAAAARQAWRLADNDASRFGAAMTLAQALSLQDRRNASQWWLRQAAEVAPSPQARQLALRDFNYVRKQNPWNFRFDLSFRPSNNINNGAEDPIFEFLGLPFVLSGDALALSGWEGAIGISARYRLYQDTRRQTDLQFTASQDRAWLTAEAKAQAPNVEVGDYDFAAVEAGLVTRTWFPGNDGIMTSSVALGHNWYGGQDLTDYIRSDLSFELPMKQRRGSLFASATYEVQVESDGDHDRAEVLTLRGGRVHYTPEGHRWKLSAGVRANASPSFDNDYTALFGQAEWQAGSRLWGMSWGSFVTLEGRDYPISAYTFDGRQDFKWSAGITLGLDKLDYMGFSPLVTLSSVVNRSNVSLYDTRTLGIGLSLKSSF